MQEKSLKVYEADKTFFSKITNTLNRFLTPGKMGINGVIISIKRNNLLKNYENYVKEEKESNKKGTLSKKYEESYTLYLEAIDKNVIEAIYKKVKNGNATEYEKKALSDYYMIIHLKDDDYMEYKYKKQKFLIDLDYECVKDTNKNKLLEKFSTFYCDKIESLYKNIIKQYSIKLAENLSEKEKNDIYEKIFVTLDEYIVKVLPEKMKKDPTKEIYIDVKPEYESYVKFSNNKLAQNDTIEKNMILLGISRKLFTHSLPLTIAEQCYLKLIEDTRSLLVDTRLPKKKEKSYEQLLDLIEEYNLKILSTKVYWDNNESKQQFREFWKKYQELENITDKKEKAKQREILFIRDELTKARKNEKKYEKLISLYKSKLVDLGVLKRMTNKCTTLDNGIYIKGMEKKSKTKKARVKKN